MECRISSYKDSQFMSSLEQLYKSLLDHLTDGIRFVDVEGKILYWNKAAEDLTGYNAEDILGKNCFNCCAMHLNAQGKSICGTNCPLAFVTIDATAAECHSFLRKKSGQLIPIYMRIAPVWDSNRRLAGTVELFSDDSPNASLLQQINELEKLALIDPLTRLGNRQYLTKRIQSAISQLQRYSSQFGILFLDIDHFKHVNDVYGHDVGDGVLKMVANALVIGSRPFDEFGRWGGEEFVGVIPNVDSKGLVTIAERLRSLIKRPYLSLGSKPIRVTISIGATLGNKDDSCGTLVRRADHLMYNSKKEGRDRVSYG